jgi:transcriptional regulator with XRE-family HTH domain
MRQNKLKEILTKEGFRQSELSQKSELSLGTINKICSQKRFAAPTTLNRIINSLNSMIGKQKYTVEQVFGK